MEPARSILDSHQTRAYSVCVFLGNSQADVNLYVAQLIQVITHDRFYFVPAQATASASQWRESDGGYPSSPVRCFEILEPSSKKTYAGFSSPMVLCWEIQHPLARAFHELQLPNPHLVSLAEGFVFCKYRGEFPFNFQSQAPSHEAITIHSIDDSLYGHIEYRLFEFDVEHCRTRVQEN